MKSLPPLQRYLVSTAVIIVGLFLVWFGPHLFGFSNAGSLLAPKPVPGETTLWSDIPVFQGSTPDLETNYFFNHNHETVMVGISYHTGQKPETVAAYYTNELMAQQGWEPQPYDIVNHFSVGSGLGPATKLGESPGGCEIFTFHNRPATTCSFHKVDDQGHEIDLDIFAALDEKDGGTRIDYTRVTPSSPEAP